MPTDAQTLLDDTYAKVQALQTMVDTALGNLTDAAALPYLSWFDWSATPAVTLDPAGSVSLGALPVMAPVNTALTAPQTRTPLTLAALPQLREAALQTAQALDYQPVGFAELKSMVLGLIESGGANVSAEVQAAVYDQGRERALQAVRDALDLAGARTGAKGFRYTNSMTKAQQTEILDNYTWQRSDLSREITRTMANLAQANLQAALAAGVSIEQALAGIALKSYEVLLDGQRLVVERFRTESAAYVAQFEAQLKAVIADLEAEKLDETLALEYLSGQRQQISLENQASLAQFEAGLKGALAQLDADKTVEELAVRYQEQTLAKWRTEVESFLEKGKAQVQQSEHANALRMESIKQIAAAHVGMIQNLGTQAVSIVTKKT